MKPIKFESLIPYLNKPDDSGYYYPKKNELLHINGLKVESIFDWSLKKNFIKSITLYHYTYGKEELVSFHHDDLLFVHIDKIENIL